MNHVCLVMGTMVLVTGMLCEIIFTKFFREIGFTEKLFPSRDKSLEINGVFAFIF